MPRHRRKVENDDGRRGMAVDSLVSGGCIISGAYLDRSLLFSRCRVNSYCKLHEAVLLPGVNVGRHSRLKRVVVDRGCRIPEGTVVGEDPVALHELDFEQAGFAWIDCHDESQSVVSFVRRARDGSFAVVVLNFTPVPRHGYRIGVPVPGRYREIFNGDSRYYGGGDVGNNGRLEATSAPWMGQPAQLELALPPLAGLIVMLDGA